MFKEPCVKLKKNPGFLTTIKRDKSSNVLTINVSGINDIMYLQTIPIYIDSILRITQSSSIDKKYNIKGIVFYPEISGSKLIYIFDKSFCKNAFATLAKIFFSRGSLMCNL